MSAGSRITSYWFPRLTPDNHSKTSEPDARYNCIAWAAGRDDSHWWPDEDEVGEWPIEDRRETIECFEKAYAAIGYERCESDKPDFEPGYEKIAIFADGQKPRHAARQKENGKWTSKMGLEGEDIEHEWGVLDGPSYGRAVRVMRRPIKKAEPEPP